MLARAGKHFALSLLSGSGAFRLGEAWSSRDLRVLTYHRVIPRERCPAGQRPPNTHFTDEFDEQMAFVARRFHVLGGEELRGIIDGTRPIPRYALAVTFDDGYENNFTHALPILQRHGLHAVFFLTTSLIGSRNRSLWFDRLDRLLTMVPSAELLEHMRRIEPRLAAAPDPRIRPYFKKLPGARQSAILDLLERQCGHGAAAEGDGTVHGMMNWDQVRSMVAAGMTIGSHTAHHQILAAVPPAEVQSELRGSRQRIEEETGKTCWCFAYPNGGRGDFRESDERAVRDAGYLCAFTQIPGSIDRHAPRYALPRIPIPDTGDMRVFRSHVSGIQRAIRSVFPGE
jgi:peptidoglycan/xylan/chitin deacetylase (PgdA/CDA1 family)